MIETHNLAKPSKKATIEITNIKPIVPKWIKPQIINPTFIPTPTPNTHNL